MAYENVIDCGDYTEHTFCELKDDEYETGDEYKCPVCGAELDCYRDLNFTDGGIQVIHYCKCGKVLTFNYFLCNVVAEDRLE